ncbi:MAG: DUF6544 family protein [Oscillatoria sp. PMC 1051.18]|nr:DUF6544 family protein [Oscillatoria sp. PMC 1050.18]MEC5031928.1 DUF6544 family protein [Oscillatoria sp. PMC 1051.18]
MTKQVSLNALWESAKFNQDTFHAKQLSQLPQAAQSYLEHAIAPGTKLASAVRLKMHGEIKLRGWLPFTAEQVISRSRGTIWSATVSMNGLPIRGSDRIVDGVGAMQWKLWGLIPVMQASGLEIAKSTFGRFQAELVWLPSIFCGNEVSWTTNSSQLQVSFPALDDRGELSLTTENTGRLNSVELRRWGNPDNTEFRYLNFGGIVEQEGNFGGYTIPTRLRVGWYMNSDRFESEGEFFRVTVDDAIYR